MYRGIKNRIGRIFKILKGEAPATLGPGRFTSTKITFKDSPILIYQMGKVGSSSVYTTLKTAGLPNPVFHVHQLSDLGLGKRIAWLKRNNITDLPRDVRHFQKVRQLVDNTPPNRSWHIVTMTREPIGVFVAGFFENMKTLFHKQLLAREEKSEKEKVTAFLLERLEKFNPENDYYATWFDIELKALFNIDVYAQPYDFKRGFSIYRTPRADCLLIRLEDLSRSFQESIKEFLGIDQIELVQSNLSQNKNYADLYRQVKAELKIPRPLCQKIYSTKYARHFYTPREIDGFITKWSGT